MLYLNKVILSIHLDHCYKPQFPRLNLTSIICLTPLPSLEINVHYHMTCLVRALAAHPIKTSARWRNFSQRCIAMIIEDCKLQFGSIINLLLRFILHVSALQLMLWLQSYDRLKFCATDRKFGGRIQGQDSMGFGGRIRDHVTFVYLLSRCAPKTFVYLLSRRAQNFSQ